MGKQNEGYDWEKCIRNNSSNRKSPLYKRPSNIVSICPKKNSNFKRSLYPIISLLVIWYSVHFYIKTPITIIPDIPVIKKYHPQIIPGGITLKRDRQGHFRGTILINGVPMAFMIDTGATRTVIPRKMAVQASLPIGRTIQTHTAGGEVLSHETHVNKLQIGNAVIRNLPASINHHLKEVLIGMNTLKYFRMVQSGDTLTLVSNDYNGEIIQEPVAVINNDPYSSQIKQKPFNGSTIQNHRGPTELEWKTPVKRAVAIKKRVTCSMKNAHKTCSTSYSDR
jgi:aspartyl protease family protein